MKPAPQGRDMTKEYTMACIDTNTATAHFAVRPGDTLPCGHAAARQADGSLACEAPVTANARVTLTGSAGPLYGRTGRAERHEGSRIWLVELDPSSDPIPGDYYPNGGFVSVYERNLTAN